MNLNETFQAVRLASRKLALTDEQTVNNILLAVADEALLRTDEILEANLADLERMDPSNPKYDRLKLTKERLAGIAQDMRNVAYLPSPHGRVLDDRVRPHGLTTRTLHVPFHVTGIIHEAPPNVS